MPKVTSPYKRAYAKPKYGNKKTTVDGITFDSKDEAKYYRKLAHEKEMGLIKGFELQPSFELQPAFEKNGTKHRAITYKADFQVYHNSGITEVVDVKGKPTEVFKIKHKLFEFTHPHLHLAIVKAKGAGFVEVNTQGEIVDGRIK